MTEQPDPSPAVLAKTGPNKTDPTKTVSNKMIPAEAAQDKSASSQDSPFIKEDPTITARTQEIYSCLKQLSEQKWITGLPISHRLFSWIIIAVIFVITSWGLHQSARRNLVLYDARLHTRISDVTQHMQVLALQASRTAQSIDRLAYDDYVSYLRALQRFATNSFEKSPAFSGIFIIKLSTDFAKGDTPDGSAGRRAEEADSENPNIINPNILNNVIAATRQNSPLALYLFHGMSPEDVTIEPITNFDEIESYRHFLASPLKNIPPYFFTRTIRRGQDILEIGYPIVENGAVVGSAGVHIPAEDAQAIMQNFHFTPNSQEHAHDHGHIDIFIFDPVQRTIELSTDSADTSDSRLAAILDQKFGERTDDFVSAQSDWSAFYRTLWRAFAAIVSSAGPGDDFYIATQRHGHGTIDSYINRATADAAPPIAGTQWIVGGRIKAKELGLAILSDWLFSTSGFAVLMFILALLYNSHFHQLQSKINVLGREFRKFLYGEPVDFSVIDLKDKGVAGTFGRILRLWNILSETFIHHSKAMEYGDYNQPVPAHNISNVFAALEKARLGRAKADKAMQQKYDLIFNLFNLGNSAIALKDNNYKYVLVNQNWQELTGLSRDLVIGRSDFDLFDVNHAQTVRGIDQVVRLSGTTNQTEWPGEFFDDHDQRTYFMTTFAFKPENGLVSGVCNVIADVTSSSTLQRQLSEQLAIQRDLFDTLPYPTLFIGPDGDVRDINRAGTDVFGLQPKDLVGRPVKKIPLLPKRYVKAIKAELKRAKNDKEPASQEISFRLLDKKMHHFICWTRALSTVAAPGGLMVILMEITQTRKTQQELVKQVEELASAKRASFNIMMDLDRERKKADTLRGHAEAATRAKADFLATMSHEIRTPMNSIIGLLDVFMESELPTDQQVMLETVRDSAFSLLQIINDILDFSKIEAGKLLLESLPISIEDLTESSLETLLPSAQKKDLSISCWVDPAIPERVLGDQVRLRQVLFNLLGNAIKFTRTTAERKGQVSLLVRMAAEGNSADNPRLEFSIRDNGVGIREEVLSTLFLPFMQAETSTTRRFGGTGLGLTISKNLIDMMEGAISASSTEGEGSVFTFYVPLVADINHVPKSRPDLSGLRILLFLKHEESMKTAQSYLEAHNATVERAESADEIVPRLREATRAGTPYNVMLTNSRKQEGDWPNLLAVIRRTKTISPINFVILTKDRRVRKGISLPDKVIADEMPIRRGPLIHAVALASGRVSPDSERAVQVARAMRNIPAPEEAAKQGRLILVVEDNLTNQYVIRRQLSVLGYVCEIADNGQEAVAAMQEKDFALVLTDCHMPVMDGYELTKVIRDQEAENKNSRRLPIVAITANALQGEGEACIEAGMDDYLPKPIELTKLQEALRTWLPPEKTEEEKTEEKTTEQTLEKEMDDKSDQKQDEQESLPPEHQADESQQDILIDWPRLFRNTTESKDETLYRIDDALTMISRRLEDLIATKLRKQAVDQIKQIRLSTIAIYSGRLMEICDELEETTLSRKAGRKKALDALYQELRDAVQEIREQTKLRRKALMAEPVTAENIVFPADQQWTDVLAPDKLLKDFGGDVEIVKELISEFIRSSASVVQEIEEAVAKRRWDDARHGGHKLKSAARAIGAHQLADLCNEIEFTEDDPSRAGTRKSGAKSMSEIERLAARLPAVFQAVADAAARLRLPSA